MKRLLSRTLAAAALAVLPATGFAQTEHERPRAPGAEHDLPAAAAHEGTAAETAPHQAGAGEHGEHGKGEAHGEHGGGHHELAPINWADFSNHEQLPYLAALINFVVLLAIYIKFGKKPVAEALKKRKTDIAADIEEAARVKREAEERAKKYQADLANLDKDLEVARQALVDAGKKERERIVAEAKERAARMKREADVRLEQEAKQKNLDLTLETIEAATAAAESLLKSKLTQDDHVRLAEEFLADLGKRPANSITVGGAA